MQGSLHCASQRQERDASVEMTVAGEERQERDASVERTGRGARGKRLDLASALARWVGGRVRGVGGWVWDIVSGKRNICAKNTSGKGVEVSPPFRQLISGDCHDDATCRVGAAVGFWCA